MLRICHIKIAVIWKVKRILPTTTMLHIHHRYGHSSNFNVMKGWLNLFFIGKHLKIYSMNYPNQTSHSHIPLCCMSFNRFQCGLVWNNMKVPQHAWIRISEVDVLPTCRLWIWLQLQTEKCDKRKFEYLLWLN